jgi:hypothetical protein
MTSSIDVTQDPSQEFVTELMNVVRAVYSPTSDYPPVGGGSTKVHFVSGEGPSWDPLAGRIGEQGDDEDCPDPFLWVRLVNRYRSETFPEATMRPGCPGIPVLVLEVGVGRCVNIDAAVDWSIIATEAEWGLDDAFRLDKIVCVLTGYLGERALVAAEPITPEGPDGGGIVWSTTIFIGIV